MKPSTQRGSATLLLALTLVVLAALATASASRGVLTELLTSRSQAQAWQARWAAQAALATAKAEWLARYAQEVDPLAMLPSRACPSDRPAPRWQCLSLPLAQSRLGQAPSSWALQAWLARDLIAAPHVLELHASAEQGGAQTQQRETVLVPSVAPAAATAPGAAIVLGRSAAPCTPSAWAQVFGGISEAQLRAWSEAQARAGLHAQSQPPRSIWWIDSPADWNTTIGTPSMPALLVFSAQACAQRCPHIGTSTRIQGTVYLGAGCDDEKVRGWQSGPIEGQLVVEAGLTELGALPFVRGNPDVRQAYALRWPSGLDATRPQRMPGSRWEGS